MLRKSLLSVALAFALSESAASAPCAGFDDVEDTSPFCVSVEWMKNRGITLGCTATLFCPDEQATRLQLAAFLYRMGNVVFQQGGNAFGAPGRLGTLDGQPLEIAVADDTGVRSKLRMDAGNNIVAGHSGNAVAGGAYAGVTIAGGGGFAPNTARANFATISGGEANVVEGDTGTIGGGIFNSVQGMDGTVAGGRTNRAGAMAAVAGGFGNNASGAMSMVPGGLNNEATGNRSFAGGTSAFTRSAYEAPFEAHHGAFAWADTTPERFFTVAANEFAVRSTGGVRFVTATDPVTHAPAWTCGVTGGAGSSWGCSSDRRLKADLQPLDGADVLHRLEAVPIYRWHAKADARRVPHAGPTAQDFHAAFGLGDDHRTIGFGDAQGIAFAAIQGLNAKVEAVLAAQRARIDVLEAEIEVLRARLEPAR